MNRPFVTVIIPVYNVEGYVADCLRSVMAQSVVSEGISVECLIVDDRGTDNSMDEVRRTLSDYCGPVDFRIISRENNGGLSVARNTGILEAKGEYVYFLDSDDLITEKCLSLMYSKVLDNPGVEVVVGDMETFPAPRKIIKVKESCPYFPNPCRDIDVIRKYWLGRIPIMSCNKLILRSYLLKNNLLFKEGLIHEDNHWQANSYSSISSVAYIDEISYLYRKHPGSIISHPDVERRRIEAMTDIVCDLGKKDCFEWDSPRLEWFAEQCYGLREHSNVTPDKKYALKRLLLDILPRNKGVKVRQWIGLRYLLFPRILVRWSILKKFIGL